MKKLKLAFKEDLMPQMILMMGLPAAGKSTFINTEMKNYFPSLPHVKGFSVLNSDSQLKAMQYKRADQDFKRLKQTLTQKEYEKIISDMSYKTYEGKTIKFPLSWNEFSKIDQFKNYWKETFKKYYASYFGDRAEAQKNIQELQDKKFESSDVVIIDSTGQDADKYLKKFEEGKRKGFVTSVLYLDLPVDYSIGRDQYRGETEGRVVGEKVIKDIHSKLPGAYDKIKSSFLTDRFLKFKWNGTIIDGEYVKEVDKKKYPYKK